MAPHISQHEKKSSKEIRAEMEARIRTKKAKEQQVQHQKVIDTTTEMRSRILGKVKHNGKNIYDGIKKHWKKTMMAGIIASGIVVGQQGLNNYKQLKKELPPEILVGQKLTKQEKEKVRSQLAQEYPNLAKKTKEALSLRLTPIAVYNYNALHTKKLSPAFQEYLESATFEDLRRDQVIPDHGEIVTNNYLSLDTTWDLKEKAAKDTSDANRASIKKIREQIQDYPKQQTSLLALYDEMKTTVDEVQKHLQKKNAWKKTELDAYFLHDALFSVLVHEITPTGYHPEVKLHVLRTLLDKGFQVNLTPAVHDGVSSFNGFQTCKETHDAVLSRFPKTTAHFQVPAFEQTLDLKRQTVIATLLMFDRVGYLKEKLVYNAAFMKLWKKANETLRMSFAASLVGALHNGPYFARKGIEAMLATLPSCSTFQDVQIAFVNGIPPSYTKPHAKDTGHVAAQLSQKLNPDNSEEITYVHHDPAQMLAEAEKKTSSDLAKKGKS